MWLYPPCAPVNQWDNPRQEGGYCPVPIRLVHDRWVSKYSEPWAATLSEIKHDIEEKVMEKVFEIYIKTTPERLWETGESLDTPGLLLAEGAQ